ncbi:pentatricopeptide repeat-containing protein At1g11900 [Malania oleifera]|uniref:pentatricopeptide repeat-containing protein At1g11900 n=1 Tax=Malania oleifera TaxID=397392 RepID=UPI0025ADE049|nr:pentatricopeptide repeat-containing protein At1g11900 [Malania oleifera]
MLAASRLCRRVFRCRGYTGVFSSNLGNGIYGLSYGNNRILIRQSSRVCVKKMRGFFIHYLYTNHITSIPVRASGIWQFFGIFSESIENYRTEATQASSDDGELTDEVLNQILSAIKNDPISGREISDTSIAKFCRAGNLSAAARLLQSLRDIQIFLSPNTYSLLLAAAGEGSNIDLASQVFKDSLVSGESLTSSTYLNLAKAFTKTDDCILLLRFVRDVSDLTFPRSTIIVNRIIYAFAKSGQIDKALLIFDHIKSLKCKPDLITYNTVLGIWGHAGRVDEMLDEFASMKHANIIPDIITYNTLINSLRKLGKLDLSLVLFKEMAECGIEPDLRTYTALIDNFGRVGNIEESLRLFDEMKRRRIRPSIYVYRSLINNSKKVGKLQLAATLLNEMNSCLSDLVGPADFKRKY